MVARECSDLLDMLYQGCYSYDAAMAVAEDAYKALEDKSVPLVCRKLVRIDGTSHTFDLNYFLADAHTKPDLALAMKRAWVGGAILEAAAKLDEYDFFDRKFPQLEMIYHLRNGIAHGNRFNITPAGEKRLSANPAHTRLSVAQGVGKFQITPALNGKTVLFDYVDVADIVDVLQSAHWVLAKIAEGSP